MGSADHADAAMFQALLDAEQAEAQLAKKPTEKPAYGVLRSTELRIASLAPSDSGLHRSLTAAFIGGTALDVSRSDCPAQARYRAYLQAWPEFRRWQSGSWPECHAFKMDDVQPGQGIHCWWKLARPQEDDRV